MTATPRRSSPRSSTGCGAATRGAVSRPDVWWSDEQYDPRFGSRVDVVFENPDGVVDGSVCYGVHESMDPAVGSANRLTVRDLVAATPDALHGLWRYLCEVDLVGTIMDPAPRWTCRCPGCWPTTARCA